MRTIILAALIGCGTDSRPPPSCQQAMAHYYGVGCTYVDTSSGQPIAEIQEVGVCQQAAASVAPNCQSDFDAWLVCNDTVAGGTNAGCDCSQELMTLVACH